MKITIKEVAKLAGVSPSTVSRVISDSPRISNDTKKIVREAMKKLGYHPNAIARSLVNKSTKTIGIVMPQSVEKALLNPFFPQALSGITSAAHEKGYCVLLSTGNDERDQLKSIRNIIMSGRVDGVLLMYSSIDNAILNGIRELGTPVVIIGKPLEYSDILYVDNDNVDASYKITEQLIKKGHKKIAFLSGLFRFIVSLDRLEGYRSALINNNIEFNGKYIAQSEYLQQGGYDHMKKFLKLSEKPTAVVVTDDIMAFGVMDAIKEEGLEIPEDIEIVSFNNVPLSEFSTPKLTSIDINSYSLGYEACKLIIDNIDGVDDKLKVIVPTKVIYRESFNL